MAPGEPIVAAVPAATGPPLWQLGLPLVPLALASIWLGLLQLLGNSGTAQLALPASLLLAAGVILVPNLSRPVFLAVTDRQLICVRLSRVTSAPVGLIFAVPLAAAGTTSYRPGRWSSSLRCRWPGRRGRGRRLTIAPRWQPELEAVVAALRAAGGYAGLPLAVSPANSAKAA
jgi:hypothetical protein